MSFQLRHQWSESIHTNTIKSYYLDTHFKLTFVGIISDMTTNGIGNIPHDPKYRTDEAQTIGIHPNSFISYPSDCKYVNADNAIRLIPVPTVEMVSKI